MALKISNLSKRYKDKWVLRDVSFQVSDGEIFGVYGRSGAGKSWLLECLHGSRQATGGTIGVDGNNPAAGRARFSSTLEPSPTPFLARLFGRETMEAERTRRQASIDQAINNTDQLLLLNNAFGEMDSSDREKTYDALRKATNEKGLSVILASNNFDDMLRFCDRVAVLDAGEILQIAPPQEIYEQPVSKTVAAVTGRNNLFPARRLTSSKADVPEFHTIDGGHRLFAQHVERGALGALNQNVTLGIRPEQVSISFGASFPADNLLKATVDKVTFLGATTLVELDAGGLKLTSLVLRLVGLAKGDECLVALPPDRIQIFKD